MISKTASLGTPPVRNWQAFSISTSAAGAIAAPTAALLTYAFNSSTAGSLSFTISSTGTAWLDAGSPITLSGVTLGGALGGYILDGNYIVQAVSTAGATTTFTVKPIDRAQTPRSLGYTFSGGSPTVALNITNVEAVIFKAPSSNSDSVLIGVDNSWTTWVETIGAGQSYQIGGSLPATSYDLTTYWVKPNSGTQSLQIRFI